MSAKLTGAKTDFGRRVEHLVNEEGYDVRSAMAQARAEGLTGIKPPRRTGRER